MPLWVLVDNAGLGVEVFGRRGLLTLFRSNLFLFSFPSISFHLEHDPPQAPITLTKCTERPRQSFTSVIVLVVLIVCFAPLFPLFHSIPVLPPTSPKRPPSASTWFSLNSDSS